MKFAKRADVPREAGPIFTLDRDGGLVVSRKVIFKEGIMRRQLEATKALHERQVKRRLAKQKT